MRHLPLNCTSLIQSTTSNPTLVAITIPVILHLLHGHCGIIKYAKLLHYRSNGSHSQYFAEI